MTQETPQSTRPSRPWLAIVGLIILALIGGLVVAALACPKPNPGKPVPADTAPPPGLAADGPQKQDEGKSGQVTG